MKPLEKIAGKSAGILLNQVLKNPGCRNIVLKQAEKLIYKNTMKEIAYPEAVREEVFIAKRNLLYSLNRALDKASVAPKVREKLLKNLAGKILIRENKARKEFISKYKTFPPGFLTISPGATCNLKCVGCYANSSDSEKTHMNFETFSRIIEEKEKLWGNYFSVISGGEPFLWKSGDKNIFDVFEKFPDEYFMVYTNGTLIDKKTAARLAELGNVTTAISIEGFEEATDSRRGKGTYRKILQAFANLREAGVPFGVSLTATRKNAEVVMSEKFMDFCFNQNGAIYGWIFQYMPIGRAYTMDLVVTPEQRLWMYHQEQYFMRKKRLFFLDFWNGGPMSYGCLAGGRKGGYFYINWNGDISPCVFFPYSRANIKDIYKSGENLNAILFSDFFKDIRQWQKDYGFVQDYNKKNNKVLGNWLRPCPMRDHYEVALDVINKHNANPIDLLAADAMHDCEYHKMMIEYGGRVGETFKNIWTEEYLKKEKSAA